MIPAEETEDLKIENERLKIEVETLREIIRNFETAGQDTQWLLF